MLPGVEEALLHLTVLNFTTAPEQVLRREKINQYTIILTLNVNGLKVGRSATPAGHCDECHQSGGKDPSRRQRLVMALRNLKFSHSQTYLQSWCLYLGMIWLGNAGSFAIKHPLQWDVKKIGLLMPSCRTYGCAIDSPMLLPCPAPYFPYINTHLTYAFFCRVQHQSAIL